MTVRTPVRPACAVGAAAALVLLSGAVVAAPARAEAGTAVRTAPAAAPPAVRAASTGGLEQGDHGAAVLRLQKRLTALGYWLGTPDGSFGGLTHQAVVALQKAAGLRRDGVVGPATRAALDRGVRPKATTRRGRTVEIDLERQLLLVVRDGRVVTVLNTSTGTGKAYTSPSGHRAVATTPRGTFHVTWTYNGWRTAALGRLYRPRYFHPRGIAVHGATSVPAYPASHGCARVSVAAMDLLWRRGDMPVGATVVVR